jgi:hypothetical protein
MLERQMKIMAQAMKRYAVANPQARSSVGCVAFVQDANDQEQSARGQTMVDHLYDAARDALLVEGKQTEHANPNGSRYYRPRVV